jgi:hypothetical protein
MRSGRPIECADLIEIFDDHSDEERTPAAIFESYLHTLSAEQGITPPFRRTETTETGWTLTAFYSHKLAEVINRYYDIERHEVDGKPVAIAHLSVERIRQGSREDKLSFLAGAYVRGGFEHTIMFPVVCCHTPDVVIDLLKEFDCWDVTVMSQAERGMKPSAPGAEFVSFESSGEIRNLIRTLHTEYPRLFDSRAERYNSEIVRPPLDVNVLSNPVQRFLDEVCSRVKSGQLRSWTEIAKDMPDIPAEIHAFLAKWQPILHEWQEKVAHLTKQMSEATVSVGHSEELLVRLHNIFDRVHEFNDEASALPSPRQLSEESGFIIEGIKQSASRFRQTTEPAELRSLLAYYERRYHPGVGRVLPGQEGRKRETTGPNLGGAGQHRSESEIRPVDLTGTKPGPIRHQSLGKEQLAQVRLIYRRIAPYIGKSFEEFERDFLRDMHPEREIAVWSRIAAAHAGFLKERPASTNGQRTEACKVLLVLSMGAPKPDDVEPLFWALLESLYRKADGPLP